ncbi:MAG: GNAT family N-acetyltransferase [Crocinitomicaceae bacterium]|nr:GNAT family N-acetyltransferase [Crocinitomicaceae bacterium]
MLTIDETTVEGILYNTINRPTELEKHRMIKFLRENLSLSASKDEESIRKALEYALKERMSFGGFIIVQKLFNEIIGITVVNHTGMEGYMPENILVYIAVSDEYKKKGIGKLMIRQVLNYAKGEIVVLLRDNTHLVPIFENLGFKKTVEGMIIER